MPGIKLTAGLNRQEARNVENTTILLLNRWKEKEQITSDYEAAKRLGVSRATVSHWRKRDNHADVIVAARMAEDLGMEVIEILAAIQADREIRPSAQAVWRRYGRPAFVSLIAGVATALFSPSDAVGKVERDHFDTGAETAETASYTPIMRNQLDACWATSALIGPSPQSHISNPVLDRTPSASDHLRSGAQTGVPYTALRL